MPARDGLWSVTLLPLLGITGALAASATGCASIVDRLANKVEPDTVTVSDSSRAFHRTLRIVDLHADPLVLGRDLLERGSRGQVDIPRLVEGNVWVQGFGTVAVIPSDLIDKGLFEDSIYDVILDSDLMPRLAQHERWPFETHTSRLARVRFQAARLDTFASQSQETLRIIITREHLRTYLDHPERDTTFVVGFLSLEGGDALEEDPDRAVRVLYEAGIRMIGLVHFHGNQLGGSSTGLDKGGLTNRGKHVLRQMSDLDMIVDLAHASDSLINDVVAFRDSLGGRLSVMVSHTGVNRPDCTNERNVSASAARKIADADGIIGIAFFKLAVCGEDSRDAPRVKDIVDTIVFYRDSVDEALNSIALGSDWDGMVAVPFDASNLVQLTNELLRRGFETDQIRRIMGENALGFLERALPRSVRP